MLQKADIIIWDEAVMAHKHTFMAVDRTLGDIVSIKYKNNSMIPFGNKLMLFGRDFRQILPVVKRGNRSSIVNASIKMAPFWKYVTTFHLKDNMRIKSAAINLGINLSQLNEFSDYLLSIGEGLMPNQQNTKYVDEIQLPPEIAKNMDEIELIKQIYPNIEVNGLDANFMCTRAILAAKNSDVDKLNEMASNYFPGEAKVYLSADTVTDDSQKAIFPTEFLNKIIDSSLPQHRISLKINQPVILLRNIAQNEGLCNGTRLIIREMHRTFLDAEIAIGKNKGKRYFIPKLAITPSDLDHPITIKRIQFPVRSAFAMTVNKSQGATLNKVGLYLNEPVFSHGQLYVALSRVSSMNDITVATNGEIEGVTRNVVYKEIFR